MQPGGSRKQSPWSAIAWGFARLLVLGMLGYGALMAVMYWIAYRQVKGIERAENDPKAAEASARKILDWSELPGGYRPAGAFSVPYLVGFALFTDLPPSTKVEIKLRNPSASFKERGFIFLSTSHAGRPRELQDFVDGKGEQPAWTQVYADFEFGELIGRGRVKVNGRRRPYSANRGWFNFDGNGPEGIITLLEIDCPADELVRMGVWFGPDPYKAKPIEESDYTGTNADPKEIAAFASHFRFCPDAGTSN